MLNLEAVALDAVLDVSNKTYQNELNALFRSLATNPSIPADTSKEAVSGTLRALNSRHCIYISDHLDDEKVDHILTLPIPRLDLLLLVDDETKATIGAQKSLLSFSHVLSCNQQHVPHQQIMTTVKKIREQKFFGVDKCVTYGAYVHRYVLSHSDQRQWFRDSLYEFVRGLANMVNRPMDSYAQFAVEVQEELLMNAIWDANPKLKSVDRRVPVALLPQETVQVEWSFDGINLAIGVRDPFGSFEHRVLEKYLKFLFMHDRRSLVRMQQEAAGAGLGLFMVLERLNSLIVTVAPGKATEVIATLNLTASPRAMSKRQRSFQFFTV